jgi:hypothetical protein
MLVSRSRTHAGVQPQQFGFADGCRLKFFLNLPIKES